MADKIEYSPQEEKLLKVLRARKSADTAELSKLIYDDDVPFHSGPAITAAMRSLMRKVSYNKEDFKIEKTPRRGPYPIAYSLRKKEGRVTC